MWTANDIRQRPTLCVGQADDLKVDTGTIRVWLSRVTGEVSIEALRDGRWVIVQGEGA